MASLFYDLLTFFGINATAPRIVSVASLYPCCADPVPVRVRHD